MLAIVEAHQGTRAVSFRLRELRRVVDPGLLAFAAGFSEPFFLGIVQRVAVVSDRQPADEKRRSNEPSVT
jgi:hypothetical protein